MNKKSYIILGIIAGLGFFVVGFDQGHIYNTIYGEQAFIDLYIHEMTHDMRHYAGFDCHDKIHNETVWGEDYG